MYIQLSTSLLSSRHQSPCVVAQEAVVAIDMTLLLSAVIVFITTVTSVVQVRRCIAYRAGEDAVSSAVIASPLRHLPINEMTFKHPRAVVQ